MFKALCYKSLEALKISWSTVLSYPQEFEFGTTANPKSVIMEVLGIVQRGQKEIPFTVCHKTFRGHSKHGKVGALVRLDCN